MYVVFLAFFHTKSFSRVLVKLSGTCKWVPLLVRAGNLHGTGTIVTLKFRGLPSCCHDGWKITLAGSRFLKPVETRYAPVEAEALAIAWSLEQTRHFTQGCDNLIVVTDHKPLVKLFGDCTLDEIANPRLFRLKQRSLM